ncbi:unnamed protein product, partial [Iphiclides podalirius]
MECQPSDSKKLFKVFDAAKRKRIRKKRDGIDDSNSLATDDSTNQEDAAIESVPQDQDSFIYQFLEEAIKRDKKKQRHMRRHEERKASCERGASATRDHRHHRRRHREDSAPARDRDDRSSRPKETPAAPVIDQSVLLETFAQLCAQMNSKTSRFKESAVSRTISHKSLQCEVVPRRDTYDASRSPTKLQNQREISPLSRIRSHENFRSPMRDKDSCTPAVERHDYAEKCVCCSPQNRRYGSNCKMEIAKSRSHMVEDAYRGYPQDLTPTGSCVDARYALHRPDHRAYKDYPERREPVRDRYGDDRKRYCEQKASRSFEIQREYADEVRATSRSDPHRAKRPEVQRNRRYCDRHRDRYYEDKPVELKDRVYGLSQRLKSRRHLEQSDRSSVVSRDVDERERLSERERDSGLSGADGETSTVSGKSNYMRVVKQEIAEQREAMDKMMKLWKELMRCFKGMSQAQGQEKTVQEAEHVRDSAAEQLRLWRECMRRYETVARDVGDTDARLMEEINKQRSEMAEMASMWQECLQRYRDMSNDFNSLKKQLVTPESPQRAPPPLLCAEGEGAPPPAQYRLPPTYQPASCPMPAGGAGGAVGAEGLRGRASAPPAWWWAEGPPRRRSSPDSRASRDRRHRRKERDDTRYKEKPSKTNGARSEHRHRKR